jgi:hypothetical protein
MASRLENLEPGEDVEGELEPRPGIREQPGPTRDMGNIQLTCILSPVSAGEFN